MDADANHWRIEDLLGESSWLSALARELVADRALADDVAQDTWVAALRTPPPRATPLRPWLARVARNFAKQRARGESRRTRRELEHASDSDTASPGADELSARLEGQRLLITALGELAEPYRSTVLLVYFEHLTSAEIAQREGIAASTVRWRLQQALDQLRTRLDAQSHGERRHWALALAPLARSTPGASVAAPSFLAGVLAMSVFWKTAAAGAVVVLTLAGLSVGGVIELPFLRALGAATPRVDVTFAPLEASSSSVELSEPRASATAREVSTPARAPASAVTARARFLDEQGAPIAGVHVRALGSAATSSRVRGAVHAPAPHAASADDGRVEIVFDSSNARRATHTLRAEHIAFATRDLELPREDDARPALDLGDVVLVPGGAIAGRVRTADGAPVEGVLVGVTPHGVAGDREHMRRAPFPLVDDPATRTDARGEFTLRGVPAGFVVLATEHADFLATLSGSIEVRAAQVSRGVELVLEPPVAAEVVDGVVLSAAGVPVPNALLRWRVHGLYSSSGTKTTDDRGRFRFVVADGDLLDLEAQSPDGQAAIATARDLAGGTHDVELRLGTLRTFSVEPQDPRGAPVARFTVSLVDATSTEDVSQSNSLEQHVDGRATLHVPAQPFRVIVDADGFRRWTSGTLAPDNVDARLVVSLTPMPELRGVVRAGGAPVRGARVGAFALTRSRTLVNGFPSRVEIDPLAATTTDEEGRFALTVREDARLVVGCEHAGFAVCELGPFDYDASTGLDGLSAELTPGGAIEGRVLVAPGASTAGHLVAFSRGDGRAFSVRADDRGAFRAEHLAPGPWQVARVEREVGSNGTLVSRSRSKPYTEVPSNCIVVEGATTRCDVPLEGARAQHVVAGTLTIDGAPAAGWRATLLGEADPSATERARIVDGSGRFELAVDEPGAALFGFSGAAGPLAAANFLASVAVGGERTAWSADLRQATLVVTVASAGEAAAPWMIVVSAQPGVHGFFAVPAAPGEHALTVAAGRAKLVRFVEPEKLGTDPERWPAQAEVVVAPGGTARLAVP